MTRRPEQALHMAAVKYLRAHTDCLVFHPANNSMTAWRGAQMRALGVLKGVPDLVLMWNGRVGFIEFKSDRGRLTPEQADFFGEVERQGHLTAVVRSMPQLLELISQWGIPELVLPAAEWEGTGL